MTEYGRIHTDGSRSGGQPVIKTQHCPNCEAQAAEIERLLGAVKKERAAIVAFLRETIFNCTFADIPAAIEAGEHLK